MMYVALLRGINVGGNAKVEMKRLRALCESLGFAHVRTYINSGNVLFESSVKQSELSGLLEGGIAREFQMDIPVVVRNAHEITALVKVVPEEWANDDRMKTDVLFWLNGAQTRETSEALPTHEGIDMVLYTDGAIIWHIDRKDVTKSGLLKLVGTPLYKKMTVRNINTVRKLHTLMQG